MAIGDYQYDPATRRYRRAASGRAIPQSTIVGLRDRFVVRQSRWGDHLADQLVAGSMSVNRWETEMRAQLKTTYLAEYQLGRGGRVSMTQADYGRVGHLVKGAYRDLRVLAQDLAAGTVTEAQLRNRSRLHFGAARQAHERGRAAAFDITLPQYPADGSQACRSNCRCSWRLDERKDQVRATWVRSGGDSCATCVDNAATWNPLIIDRPKEGSDG